MGPMGLMSNRPLLIGPISSLSPIRPIKLLPSPVGEAGAGHFLADAAAFEKVALEELVGEVVRHVVDMHSALR